LISYFSCEFKINKFIYKIEKILELLRNNITFKIKVSKIPEGPEIAVIAVALQKRLPGYFITNLKYDVTSKKIKNLKNLSLPIVIKGITFKGKKLVFMLENDSYIVFSLGMSGHFSFTPRKHTRVEFELRVTQEGEKEYLYFDDSRKFGNVEFFSSTKDLLKRLNKIGLDFLSGNITYDYWLNSSKKFANKQVCQFMLNQDYISGIGNIYRADICYLAKINPLRKVNSLSRNELITLYNCSYIIIRKAFKAGSSKGYRNPNGIAGQYQYLVYMKKKDSLGNPVTSEKCKDGRTIHWVPNIQK
jgi:formamidopyrimidine-DNA glycosylase